MIPRNDSRIAGTGGGGQPGWGAGTPFFCKICGRTVGRKHVQHGVDVCKKCRVSPGRSRTRGKGK